MLRSRRKTWRKINHIPQPRIVLLTRIPQKYESFNTLSAGNKRAIVIIICPVFGKGLKQCVSVHAGTYPKLHVQDISPQIFRYWGGFEGIGMGETKTNRRPKQRKLFPHLGVFSRESWVVEALPMFDWVWKFIRLQPWSKLFLWKVRCIVIGLGPGLYQEWEVGLNREDFSIH